MAADGFPDHLRAKKIQRRAQALWPRLDRRAVARCGDDVRCIVRVISRRTTLPPDTIYRILFLPSVTEDEGATWFG